MWRFSNGARRQIGHWTRWSQMNFKTPRCRWCQFPCLPGDRLVGPTPRFVTLSYGSRYMSSVRTNIQKEARTSIRPRANDFRVETWQDTLDSTEDLLYRTKSWNSSQLHWREAKHLFRLLLLAQVDESTQSIVDGVSRTRLVLRLIERGISERKQQDNRNATRENGFPLFWDDSAVMVHCIMRRWKREFILFQKRGHQSTNETQSAEDRDSASGTASDKPEEKAKETMSSGMEGIKRSQTDHLGVPTSEEMKNWSETYSQYLPPDFQSHWTKYLFPPGAVQAHPIPRNSAVIMINELKKTAEAGDELPSRYFQNIDDVNEALKSIRCHENGKTFLSILDFLWQIPGLKPNHKTYLQVMFGIWNTRSQGAVHTMRPSVGTSLVLFELLTQMIKKSDDLENNEENGGENICPTGDHIRMVLSVMEREESSGLGKQAWLLWEYNLHLRQMGKPHAPPDGKMAERILSILSRTNPNEAHDHASKAQSVLETLVEEEERENKRMQELAVEHRGFGWGSYGETKERQQQLTGDLSKNGFVPRSKWFWESYLRCLVLNGGASSIEAAEEVVKRDVLVTQEGHIRPDAKMFGFVLRAHARNGEPKRAMSLFEFMVDTMLTNDAATPDAKTFLDVATAWTDCQTLDIEEKKQGIRDLLNKVTEDGGLLSYAANIFLSMIGQIEHEPSRDSQGEESDADFKPISVFLRMFSNSRDPKDADRAEIILASLIEHESKVPDLIPSADDYCAVIAAFSRSKGAINAPNRAENLLIEMIRQADERNIQDMQPPEQAFVSIIICWARSKEHFAAVRAQNIFDLMVNRFNKGQSKVRPSVKTYSALIQAWSSEGNPKQAELVLNRMLDDFHEGGNEAAKPDIVSFNCLLSGWEEFARVQHRTKGSQADKNTAYERTSAILELMHELHDSSELDDIPDASSYGSVISTLIHSDREDKCDLARSHLRTLLDLYRKGYKKCQPDAYTYGAVIQVLSRTFSVKGGGSIEVATEIEGYLDRILRLKDFNGRQVTFAHDAAIHVWMSLSPGFPEAVNKAESLVKRLEMISGSRQNGHHASHNHSVGPDRYIYCKLLKTYILSPSLDLDDRKKRALVVRGKMKQYKIPMDENILNLFQQCGVLEDKPINK